jgi:hypothetical protein
MPLPNGNYTNGELCDLFGMDDYCALPPNNDSGLSPVAPANTTGLTNVKIQTNTGGIAINTGQTTLDKILSAISSNLATIYGRSYVPTTVIPTSANQSTGGLNNQQTYNPNLLLQAQLLQQQQGSTGANVENFIKNNTGLILLAVGAFVLLQMKPISR